MTTNDKKIALIGFGEAGQAFASGWRRPPGGSVAAYDIKMAELEHAEALVDAGKALSVQLCETNARALAGAGTIFSLVTADRAHEAASLAAAEIEKGAYFFDCNSCSPATKVASASAIEAAGGRYVDVAVMAPVHPKRHETPLLISGRDAEEAAERLMELGMRPRIAGAKVGEASSIKMLRSVVIKGLEALTAEAMLAARKAGVEEAVLASLEASDPGIDWPARSAYNLERMMVHGARRAAEMREVAATLRELGLPDRMARAITDWQADISALQLAGGEASLSARADRILAALGKDERSENAL